jgi:hypothetical protein
MKTKIFIFLIAAFITNIGFLNAQKIFKNHFQTEIEYYKPYILNDIKFGNNSDKLFSTSQKILKDFYLQYGNQACRKILILGHTDDVGSKRYNQRLSKYRAQEVIYYFERQKFDTNKFLSIGFGEDCPIADNSTPEGQAKNRRIEIVFLPDTANLERTQTVEFYKSLDSMKEKFYRKHQLTEIQKISIYPNPIVDYFQVDGLIDLSEMCLYSIKGELVMKRMINQEKINISALPAGIYLLKISNKSQMSTKQIVKK